MGQGIISHKNEKAFQTIVIATARENGWMVYHTFDSRKSEPGYPDLCMVKNGFILFVELKTDTGKVTTAQRQWIEQFIRHQHHCQNILVEIWRPHIWEEKKKLLIGDSPCYHNSVRILGAIDDKYSVCNDCGQTIKGW